MRCVHACEVCVRAERHGCFILVSCEGAVVLGTSANFYFMYRVRGINCNKIAGAVKQEPVIIQKYNLDF